jgi:cyclopropane fatty-acyl-phospholipid synthase-like methyltransferase
VLRPGGQVLLCDIIQQRELPLHAVIARRDDFLLLKDVFGRAVMKTAEYYEEQAAAHGFHSVKYLDITNQTAPTFARWNDNANTSREQICEMLGRKAWVDFRRSTEILKNFWDEGVLGYFMLTARKPAQ